MEKKIKKILNILFWIVVITAIVWGWNMEIDNPESLFPNPVSQTQQK